MRTIVETGVRNSVGGSIALSFIALIVITGMPEVTRPISTYIRCRIFGKIRFIDHDNRSGTMVMTGNRNK